MSTTVIVTALAIFAAVALATFWIMRRFHFGLIATWIVAIILGLLGVYGAALYETIGL